MLYDLEMSLGSRIKSAREVRDWKQTTLARALDVSPQAVSQWERDKDTPGAERLREIAKALRADFYWLLEGSIRPGPVAHSPYEEQRIWRAPLIDRVAAGRWSESIAPGDLPADTRFLDVYGKPHGQLFALEISGESMEPDFSAGDVVIVDTGVEPLPGDFVVAKNADEGATFKKYRLQKAASGRQSIELVPLNQDYPTLMIDDASPGQIVGTMIEHRRFRRRR